MPNHFFLFCPQGLRDSFKGIQKGFHKGLGFRVLGPFTGVGINTEPKAPNPYNLGPCSEFRPEHADQIPSPGPYQVRIFPVVLEGALFIQIHAGLLLRYIHTSTQTYMAVDLKLLLA